MKARPPKCSGCITQALSAVFLLFVYLSTRFFSGGLALRVTASAGVR
jgi:hypothetical protein